MTNEEKLLTMIYQIISEQGKQNQRLERMEKDIQFIKEAVARIEDDHSKKLTALFHGYLNDNEFLR